jgi:membrane protease YdiL (CAAX protease family)
MLKISRILSIVFAAVFFLWGLISGIVSLVWAINAPGVFFAALTGPVVLILFGVIDFVIWGEVRKIEYLVDARRYREAKDKTLVWSIIGLILGGVLVGVFLLIAYIKYDEVIAATNS